jgi:hypothetical protein
MSDREEQEYRQLLADLEVQQRALNERWQNSRDMLTELNRVVAWRTACALFFRGVFILGGFCVSLGLPGIWPRIIGGAVTLVGLIDNQWLFNHEILMFKTPAKHATAKLLDKVANDFTDAFAPPTGGASDASNARLKTLVQNVKAARTALFNGTERIKDALNNKELGVLKKLALQANTTAVGSTVNGKVDSKGDGQDSLTG